MDLPVAGADLRAAFVASCFLGAFPPVDLRAVCLVRAMLKDEVYFPVLEFQILRVGSESSVSSMNLKFKEHFNL
jgi:hypothetical protein